MNLIKKEMHATVREGYQILMRADAELYLPEECPKMLEFYERMAQTCMRWAEEVHGEALKRDFAEVESIREKSQFHTQHYKLRIHVPWVEDGYAVYLCESELLGQWREPQKSYHRISHVWSVKEELILPQAQILHGFGMKLTRNMLPFRPDGIYPCGDKMIFFRNATDNLPFVEQRLSREIKKS
ncbi:MAG: hypothetical protein E7666_04075 [Ruminococcaceae bacterium]|nr:hypothetical protein [Oscillospiraceae bacterium]